MKSVGISLLILLTVIGLPVIANPEASAVSEICNESRQDISLEDKCQEAQDTLGYQFICDGLGYNANCWVEKK